MSARCQARASIRFGPGAVAKVECHRALGHEDDPEDEGHRAVYGGPRLDADGRRIGIAIITTRWGRAEAGVAWAPEGG